MLRKISLARAITLNFWAWWTAELTVLLSIIKPSWRCSLRRVLFIEHEGWVVIDELGAQKKKVAQIDNKELDDEIGIFSGWSGSPQFSSVDIRLSSQLGLRRTIDLPLAAKANLAQLLYYEIDRLTPFKADSVYFSWLVIETDKEKSEIKVEFVTVPKNIIDRALSIAKLHRLSIARIELEGTPEHDLRDRVEAPAKRPHLRLGMSHAAVLGCFVLLVMVSSKIIEQRKDINRLSGEITAARRQVNEHFAARKRYEQLAESARLVESSKAATPTMTETIAELSLLIPDQAYLVQLVIDHDNVQLYGFAERASALITLLEQSPIFIHPRFDSAVTMDDDNDRERFHLTVHTAKSSN